MTTMKRLADLDRGEVAVVVRMDSLMNIRRRLQDMGMIKGTQVECLGKSPLGNPGAYLIRGAVVALRNEDAGNIFVRCISHE